MHWEPYQVMPHFSEAFTDAWVLKGPTGNCAFVYLDMRVMAYELRIWRGMSVVGNGWEVEGSYPNLEEAKAVAVALVALEAV